MIPYSLNPLGVDDYDDLYWLRKIRDANPTSQLPSLWLDSEDPYTQWEGISWNISKTHCTAFFAQAKGITSLPNIHKLKKLTGIGVDANNISLIYISDLPLCTYISFSANIVTSLYLSNVPLLNNLQCDSNKLTLLPTLTSKGNITQYNFIYNNFPTSELDRFRAMGFTDESKLLPQNP